MHKEKAPEFIRGQVIQAAEIVAEASEANKQFATLRARQAAKGEVLENFPEVHAALDGWRVDRCGKHFILHRWGRCIDCADLDAVRAALLRVGVSL